MGNVIFALALLFLTFSAAAENPPPPDLPLVAPTPADGAWSFKLTSSPKGGQKSAALADDLVFVTEAHITKTGRLRLEEITTSDGKTVQNWYVEGTLILTGEGENVSATMVEPNWDRTSLAVPAGFAGFTWIKPENFVGLGEFEERPAYHYKRTIAGEFELEAWVDHKSNLPMAFRIGPRTYRYSFITEIPAPLTLPVPFQAVEQKLKAEIEYRKTLDQDLKPAG